MPRIFGDYVWNATARSNFGHQKAATVTIDATGCQKKIAEKIIGNGANYVVALKGSQGSLRHDVEPLFDEQLVK